MSENIVANNTKATEEKKAVLTADYCLKQVETIVSKMEDMSGAIIKAMEGSGDLVVEKMAALTDVIRCRETTNQQLIAFYQEAYKESRRKSAGEAFYNGEALKCIMDEMLNIIKDPMATEESRRYAEETLDGHINCLWGNSRVYASKSADKCTMELAQKDLDHAEL